jgi:hypothetical protein
MSRLDALLTAMPAPRRAALEGRVRPPFARDALRGWLAAEGAEACWVIADWARRELTALPRYGWTDGRHMNIIALGQLFAERACELADGPAVWVELVAAIPNYKPLIAREIVAAMRETPASLQAMRQGLATLAIPHRRLLAIRLRASGTLDPELALTWFADPTLRPVAEEYFVPGLEQHEEMLRERLETAKQGEREAIVRLLRRIDPRLSLAGTHDTSTDGELQARLRENPGDESTAEVWADSLIDRQDPRGELIQLELAIRRAEPERALELSRALAAHVASHRKALWNKPGGFPFREKYRGRSAITFSSDWNHTMRGKPDGFFDRVQSFVETVTDARAPRYVYIGRRFFDPEHAEPATSPLASQIAAALGGDVVQRADRDGAFVERTAVRDPIADPDALRALCASQPLTLAYEFRLAWPNTGILLPHQEGEHYAGGAELADGLRILLPGHSLQLSVTFPFESTADPRFVELHEAMCETLGRVFTPSRWVALDPSADGKKLVGKRFRFTPA